MSAAAISPAAAVDPAPTVVISQNFNSGGVPSGWTNHLGSWTVTGGKLVGVSTSSSQRSRITFGSHLENFQLDVDVAFQSVVESTRWLNLALDYDGAADNGSVANFRSGTTTANGLEFAEKTGSGSWTTDTSGASTSTLGTVTSHHLTAEVRGTRATISIDGVAELTTYTLQRSDDGLGFIVNGATVSFDNVVVTDLTVVDQRFTSGGVPSGWTNHLGSWTVSGGKLVGVSTATSQRSRVTFGTHLDNYVLDVDVNFTSVMSSARWLNLALDYDGVADTGSVVTMRSGTTAANGLEFAENTGSGWSLDGTAASSINLGTGTQHHVTARVQGSSVTVYIDNVLQASTTSFNRSDDGFGFIVSGATVAFDNVSITRLLVASVPNTAPSTPTAVKPAQGATTATLLWAAPTNPGTGSSGSAATISGYDVAITVGTATPTSWVAKSATSTSHTFTGLTNATAYTMWVRAKNSASLTGASASTKVTPQAITSYGYPLKLNGGTWDTSHVQGVAVDEANGFVYYSFTQMLVKTNLAGTILGTVTGFNGHLGDLEFNPADGLLYGSLEYKNANTFYIAIIDVDEIDHEGIDAEGTNIVTTVFLKEATDDYTADMDSNGIFDGNVGTTADHRYGASGIDGLSFGPAFGSTSGTQLLTVAYGIYSNTSRNDNNHQVLLQYNISTWGSYKQQLVESAPHTSGPTTVTGKYFVYTGNTTWGTQNLEYDSYTQRWYLAVYKGTKSGFPNYSMFAVDAATTPVLTTLSGLGTEQGKLIALSANGLTHTSTGIRGWNHDADTGMESLGDGAWYIMRDYEVGTLEGGEVVQYRWTGGTPSPFTLMTAAD